MAPDPQGGPQTLTVIEQIHNREGTADDDGSGSGAVLTGSVWECPHCDSEADLAYQRINLLHGLKKSDNVRQIEWRFIHISARRFCGIDCPPQRPECEFGIQIAAELSLGQAAPRQRAHCISAPLFAQPRS